MAISFDIPLIRLAGTDPYVVMGARGFGLALMLWLYAHYFLPKMASLGSMMRDPQFLVVGTLSGLNNIFFTFAIFNTSAASVVFILAFNALLAVLISWPLTGERPTLITLSAIAATIFGVWIIVADGLGTTNSFGDALALGCAFLLAISLTLTRKSGKDFSLAPGFGGLVSGLFALPNIILFGTMPEAPIWLALDALIFVPIAGVTLWLAPRFIPAAQVALFYLLETVCTPIWIWIVFTETPGDRVFWGGATIIIALSTHTIVELIQSKKRRPPAQAS